MSVKKKLISNTFYLSLNWGFTSFFSFLFWFILGKTLLPKEYGIVSTSLNLAVFLTGITSLGLAGPISKLIPEYLQTKKLGKVKQLIKNSIKIEAITNSIVAILLLVFSRPIILYLKINMSILCMIILCFIIISFSNLFNAITFGFQNMRKIFITNIFGQLVKIMITLILIFSGFSYFGPLIGTFLCFFLTFVLFFNRSWFKPKVEKIDQKWIMLEYALPALVATLSWMLFMNGQQIILTTIKNPEVTGIYSIAMVLCNPLIMIPNLLSRSLFPILSQLSVNRNEKKRQRHLIRLVLRYAIFITLPIALLFTLFSKPLILFFSQPEFLPASRLFPFVGLASLFYGCTVILSSNLYAIGKPKTNRNIVIVTTLTFLILTIPLTTLFSSFGMSVAYLLSAILSVILCIISLKKYIGLALPWKSIGRIILANLITFSFLFVAASFTNGLIIDVVFAIIGGIIYLVTLLLLRFFVEDDFLILDLIAEKSPFLKKQIEHFKDYFSRFIGESV